MTAIVHCPYCTRKLTSHAPHGQVPQHISLLTGKPCTAVGLVGYPAGVR